MRDEVLSFLGAYEIDTGDCLVSELEQNDFLLEDLKLNLNTMSRSGIDTAFSLTAFDYFELRSVVPNSIPIVNGEDTENSAAPPPSPPPSSSVSEEPT